MLGSLPKDAGSNPASVTKFIVEGSLKLEEIKVSFVKLKDEITQEIYHTLNAYITTWKMEYGDLNFRNWAWWDLDIRCYYDSKFYHFTIVDEGTCGTCPSVAVFKVIASVEDSSISYLRFEAGSEFEKFHHRKPNFRRAICQSLDGLREAFATV